MTNETKREEAARERREDEASQASQDGQDSQDSQFNPEEEMNEKKEVEKFEIGDAVITTVDNQEVRGVVESFQLQKNLVDVKIYEPGHRSHCLIVARPPSEVHSRTGKKAVSA